MNTLPKKFNRWIVLLVIIFISVVLTILVTKNTDTMGASKMTSVKSTPSQVNNAGEALIDLPVSVKLNYDYTAGFVDVLITNPSVIEHGELLFKLTNDVKFTKIEDNSLFEKYFTSTETDKATGSKLLRVGASKGIEGAAVKPGGDQKFARIYFSNLKQNSIILDEANSSFFVGSGNPIYKVALDK